MIYAVGPNQTLLIIDLDNVERIISGKPACSVDRKVILAAVRDIDAFSDKLGQTSMDDLDFTAGIRLMSELHKEFWECEQKDSESYINEHTARAVLLYANDTWLIFMEMRLIDELVSGAPFGGEEIGFTLMVSKNLPYIRRSMTDKHRSAAALLELVRESNLQPYEPIDIEPGKVDVKTFDPKSPSPISLEDLSGPSADNN